MSKAGGAASRRIILAEDDDEMRRLVGRVLRADGYVVDEATNGSQLLELLDSAAKAYQPVDVVITDERMPGVTGFQALDWLHQVRAWRPPTVVITAFPDAVTHLRAQQLGVHLLEKPFDLDDLRSLVRNLTGVRAAS